MVKKIILKIGLLIVFVLVLSSLSAFSLPLVHAQTCTLPTQVQNVAITFPNCEGGTCNYTQAKCSWAAVTGATGYSIVVTAVSTSTQVLNQQVGVVTSQAFTVANSDTYRCDVSAINSCGTGTTGTGSLFCQTEFVPTATPATSTTVTIPPKVVSTVVPAGLPPTGPATIVWIGFAGFAIAAIGLSMLLFKS